MPSTGREESMERRSFLRVAGGAVTAGAGSVLAGCTTSDNGTNSEDTETATKTAPSQQQSGGELVVAMQSDIETLHPHKVAKTTDITMVENLGNSLYRVDSSGEIQPDLAAEMPTISDDGKTYTVPIREGVTFHEPYDRELTADDIVANYRRILDQDYGAYGRGNYVGTLVGDDIDPEETVRKTGEYEVTFELAEPYAPFLFKQASMSSFGWFTIVPMEAVDEHGSDFGAISNGVWSTGPFKYNPDESVSGSEYVFDRNPNYFKSDDQGNQLPYVDRVVYKPIPEASVRNTQLQSGDIHVSESVAATQISSVQSSSDVEVREKPSTARMSQWLNIVNYEPTSKKPVRKAMMHAMNREAIVQTKFDGHATVSDSLFPSWHWAYDDETAVTYDNDVDEAESLLADAGYEDGFDLKCEPENQPKYVDVATILQQQFKQVGIDMTVEPVSKTAAWEPINSGPASSDWHSLIGDYTWGFSADDYTYSTFHSEAAFNYTHYSNEKADQLMEEARHVTDRDERKDLYGEVQNIVTDDMPKLFQLWTNVIQGHRSSVRNFRVWPSAYMGFEDVWIDE
ncbi:ABC transporter substrate-binding protein [Halostella sp. PRR32]|uniref:ABC transporter substrate-binding protein n=1 Tax=Halostella sp. PRR32 TaxID=3098147 RepID=UPI002B1DF785|nr:ABC transporter substrate-binding protein [Halostella sp. PRR32]